MTLVAMLLAATLHSPITLAADNAIVDVRLGATTFAVPESWIDPGWREAARTGAAEIVIADTILLVPPVDAMQAASGAAFDPEGVVAVAILLRDDPDLDWRALYVDKRIATAAAQFASATPEDAALAFDELPFDRLYGGAFASSGKSASRALHLVGSIPSLARHTVAVAARIEVASVGNVARLYSISATIRAGGEHDGAPLALAITLRMTRPLRASDLTLLDRIADIVSNRNADRSAMP